MRQLRFEPYHELAGVPNVIVDGGPTESTELTLSHWPGSPTPIDLLDDLSAQISLRALDHPTLFDGIEVVSNNHFDQDGLASAFALIHPVDAIQRRERTVDVARAGDFATYHDRDSMRIAFAIAALADATRSTLDAAIFDGTYDEQSGRLYQSLLPRFAELIDHPERSRSLWEAEDAHLTESLLAIERGIVTLEENRRLDLVTVTVPEHWAQRTTTRFALTRHEAVHPAAIHQSSDRLRVVTIQGRRQCVEMRYESWVMYRSRPVAPRPDLRILAAHLDEVAAGATTWQATGPGSLTPILRPVDDESALAPHRFVALVEEFLTVATPAWDPLQPR